MSLPHARPDGAIVMATFAGKKDSINPQDTNAFSAIAQKVKAPSTGNQAAEACEVTVDTLKNIVMISRKVLAKPGNTKLYGKMAIVLGELEANGSPWAPSWYIFLQFFGTPLQDSHKP